MCQGAGRVQAPGGTHVQNIHQPQCKRVSRMSFRESCARNWPSHWLLLLQGTENLASSEAAKTLNCAGIISTV